MKQVSNISKAAVIGAGSWGTTVAAILASNIDHVMLWGRNEDDVHAINSAHVNRRFLPNFTLPGNIQATTQYEDAFSGCQLFVWAIPVQYTRERLQDCKRWISPNAIMVNLSKGLEEDTWYRPSEIIAQECTQCSIVGTLSGPNLAAEISAGKRASATLAIANYWELSGLESLFSSSNFTVELSPHVIALELAAALKNIVAIAAGICDGLELGWNIKASVIAVGFSEIQSLGEALGANKDSFVSVFCLGDLIATCGSENSRNHTLGERIGRGDTLEEAKMYLNGRVAEGVATTVACHQFMDRIGLYLPLVDLVYQTLTVGLESEKFGKGIVY